LKDINAARPDPYNNKVSIKYLVETQLLLSFRVKERILLDAMFDVPGTDIVEVVLTEDVVRGGKAPEYVRRSPLECEEAETASAELRRSSV